MSTYIDVDGPCEFRCDRGWLPIDGELDYELDEGDGTFVFVPLLIPTTYRRCFCNDNDNLPEGTTL